MEEFDEDIPLGLSKEQSAEMLAGVRRQEAANRKRSETLKSRAAAKRAERLSRPPANLDEAWWLHAQKCPHPAYSEAAAGWFRENRYFEFDGTMWRRERTFQTTNSGKGKRLRSITYHGDDGRVVTTCDVGSNRRNDETRKWGLPE